MRIYKDGGKEVIDGANTLTLTKNLYCVETTLPEPEERSIVIKGFYFICVTERGFWDRIHTMRSVWRWLSE